MDQDGVGRDGWHHADLGAASGGGIAALQAQATLQSNVLAYNNTFLLVAVIAAATTAYLAAVLALRWSRAALAERRRLG